ncbi:L-threonylcarbamoyladenylate synthase [Roseivirga sp. BDSF3-8]|uniref:L-threonylcarbamoyladenylate synthase n=1 Tax=Roseivirga sp. BDSF3-8 TaxID=3241598 RepID=UPI0035320A2D
MMETGKDLEKARKLLRNGDLVAIPTETVYGLAANALNPQAVTRIFEVKNRPSFDPLIVHIAGMDRLNELTTNVPDAALKLAEAFWPGPLTLLLPRKPVIPDLVTSGLDTVGIRVPDHALTLELLRDLDFPLAAPSANPFGYISPTRPSHVEDQLGTKIPYVLDGGHCDIGIESTIIGFENEEIVVFRMGGKSLEEIEDVVGKVQVRDHSASDPRAPGMLKSHYAPRTRLKLVDMEDLLDEHLLTERVAILSFRDSFPQIESERQFVLSETGDLSEAARRLFSGLRELDRHNPGLILAERVPDYGLGRAINDRLRRASAGSD